MLTPIQKAKLESAMDKMHEADALVQEALGHSELCWDIHMNIEDCITDIHEAIEE